VGVYDAWRFAQHATALVGHSLRSCAAGSTISRIERTVSVTHDRTRSLRHRSGLMPILLMLELCFRIGTVRYGRNSYQKVDDYE
jgi:hypothetical protein